MSTRTLLIALGLSLSLALGGGCRSSPERDAGASTATRREPRELTPQERTLLEAYEAGGDVWESARAEALADPALETFLIDRLVLAMVRAYEGLTQAGGAEHVPEYERAQAELARLGEQSAPVLAGLLAVSDGVVATVAGTTLERIGRPAVAPLVPLLGARRSRTRQRAAEVLARLPHAAAGEEEVRLALVRRLESDPDWVVRAQAAVTLGIRGARDRATAPHRRALTAALADDDPAVTEAAAMALGGLGDPLAVPALVNRLERAVRDGDLRTLHACEASLHRITGDSQERDIAGWRSWWSEHRDDIQRARGPR